MRPNVAQVDMVVQGGKGMEENVKIESGIQTEIRTEDGKIIIIVEKEEEDD